MISHLRSAFVFTCLLSFAVAQSPPTPDLERIVRLWPAGQFAGDVTDLACGKFMANHPARFAVSLRNNEVVVSYQPALFDHFVAAGPTGVQAIATLEAFGSEPDRLVVVTAQGLRCLHYNGTNGFGDVQQQDPLAAFAGDDDIVTLPYTDIVEGPLHYVLGHKSSAVHLATIAANGDMTQEWSLPAPPSTQAYHATLIPMPIGPPLIALLTSAGLLVLDIEGNLIDSHLANVSGGRLCALPGAVAMVVQAGANWNVATWTASTGQVTGGGTLSLPAPLKGLAQCDANHDQYPDVVLTSGDPVLRVVLGSSDGPLVGVDLQSPIHIANADPGPQPPAVNLVQALVCDIDHDGADDILHVNKNKLSVFPNARSQIQQQVFSVPDDGGATPTLGFEKPLGFETAVDPIHALFPQSLWGKHGLALRLRLPEGWAVGDEVRAVLYFIPDASGAVLEAVGHYTFPLGEAVEVTEQGNTVVDLMIPVRDHTPTGVGEFPVWSGQQRYALELSMARNAGGDTKPLAMEFGNRTGNETSFVELQGTFSAGIPWWFEVVAVALLNYWGFGTTPPAGEPAEPPPNGNEFIGAIILVESIRGRERPDVNSSVEVSNAVVHAP